MKTLETLKLNGKLPSPKGVALAILEINRREDATIAAIAKVVQVDPALSGRLLHQANAAAYGGRQIVSVPEAIVRLGLRAALQLALGFSLVDQNQNGPCKAFDYQRYWSHSLLMALAMQRFGVLTRVGSPDELFACGLLAHVGCLGLATIYPAEYASLLEQESGGESHAERERKLLHTDHNELTAALLIDWGIPKALVEPVYFHESPAASGFIEGSRPYQLSHLFYLAKRVADLGVAREGERAGHVAELMLLGGKLGLNADDFGALIDRLGEQWREWGEILKLPAVPLPAFAEMDAAPKVKSDSVPVGLRVLLVDDDPASLARVKDLLGDLLGHTVFTATNGREALALAVEAMPQVVVTDLQMPVMDGIELCRALRATEWGQTIYVIMLTDGETEEEVNAAFEVGMDDFLSKPVTARALRARFRAAWHYVKFQESWARDRAQLKQFTAELAISNRRLEHIALTDLLTDLPNRRSGMMALDQAWQGAARAAQPLAVLVIDIDHFKQVNDNHGHAIGDIVLKAVAKAIQDAARKNDSICRMGGEEFLLVCGNADPTAAFLAAERLRKMVGALATKVGEAEIRTTISIGVACREADMPDAEALVIAADQALYGAKHAGRNRTCMMFRGKPIFGQPE